MSPLLAAFCLAAGAAMGQTPIGQNREPSVSVPFEMLEKGPFFSGHFAVQVKVNGKGPYRLIFDTGAPVVLLSNWVAEEAGLLNSSTRRSTKVPAFAIPNQVRVASMQIGDLMTNDVSAVVMDHPTVKLIADAFGPIDGIVGFPVFARYRTEIDYQARRLTFAHNGYQPADVLQTLMNTLLAPNRTRAGKTTANVVIPAAQWGLVVEKAADDDADGVLVKEIYPNTAAARADIRPGDRLMHIDGRWTDSVTDCFHAATRIRPGETVAVVVDRKGQKITLSISPSDGW